MSALSTTALTHRYRRAPAPALRGVDIAPVSGAIALLGPNGAGKTTLFRILSTTLTATSGRFLVGDLDSSDADATKRLRRELGYLPQHFSAFGGYTCVEFLTYVCWLRQVEASRMATLISGALGVVDLEDRRDTKIKRLSGGMRQRLGLAQALVSAPSLLLLDEPTVGLDPEQRATFIAQLKRVKQAATILLATHLVEDVAAFADHVIVLDAGLVAFEGTVAELCGMRAGERPTGPDVEAAYLDVLRSRAPR